MNNRNYLLISQSSSLGLPTIKVEDGVAAACVNTAIEKLRQSNRYKTGMLVIERETYRESFEAFWKTLGLVGY